MTHRPYNYRCRDESLLTPYLRKYLVQPVLPFVPKAIPANLITIVSNGFIYLSLLLAILYGPEHSWNFVVIALLVLAYLVGDHMDGMQAKRTKTSSALGEFCDHFLDAFNNGVLIIILALMFHIEDMTLLLYLIATSYMAHAVVFYSQFKTGWLVFEKLGSFEAVTVTMLIILAGAYTPIYNLLTSTWMNFSMMEWILILSSAGSLMTLLKTIRSAGGGSFRFIIYLILLVLSSLLMLDVQETVHVLIFLVLFNSHYIGTLMRGHLVDGKERYADIISVILLAVIILSPVPEEYIFLVSLYLSFLTVFLTVKTFYPLRKYWVWLNPKTAI